MSKKRSILFTVIIVLILATSCNHKTVDEDTTQTENNQTENAESFDYEVAFESVTIIEDDFKLDRIKVEGAIIDVLSGSKILLYDDLNLSIYDYDSEEMNKVK